MVRSAVTVDYFDSLFSDTQCPSRPTISNVCGAHRALYFLEPMLLEPGLGTSLVRRDHLALDEPNVQLTSPT